MRILLLGLVAVVACSKPNPDACCVTDEQCAQLGAGDLRPCDVGQACDPSFTCVAAECATSADCTSPDAPVCSLGLCVSNCRVDADCADVAGRPLCAADGVCVGCETDDQCPAEAALCDTSSRSCRGCIADDECASGVCVEADGRCAEDAEIIYVSAGGTDTGSCPVAAPCASLEFALQLVRADRSIIHVTGGQLDVTTSLMPVQATTIDGTGTRLLKPLNSPLLSLAAGGAAFLVTVEGVSVINATTALTFDVGTNKSLRLFAATLDHADVAASGTLEIRRSIIRSTTASCTNGTLNVEDSELHDLFTHVQSMVCQAAIRRNQFTNVFDGIIEGSGGLLEVTNNVFVTPSEFTDLINVGGHSSGSVIAFNTIVNSSSVTDSAAAITCDGTVEVSSNIFAYNSTSPLQTGCIARASLFDLPGSPDATSSNVAADATTFFVDRNNGDLHLAAGSPARELGEAGIVGSDLEGNPRPTTMPDAGAFEAP